MKRFEDDIVIIRGMALGAWSMAILLCLDIIIRSAIAGGWRWALVAFMLWPLSIWVIQIRSIWKAERAM